MLECRDAGQLEQWLRRAAVAANVGDVLSTVARVCEATSGFDQITCCGLVRDLRSNVRIVIDPGSAGAALDRSALESSLTTELGRWFVGRS